MDTDSRQAGTEITDEIEITPEMVEAGLAVLAGWVAPDDCYLDQRALVRLVYSSMEKCSASRLSPIVGSVGSNTSPSSL